MDFYYSIKNKINIIFDVGCRTDSIFTDFSGIVHYFDPVDDFIKKLSSLPNQNKKSYYNNFGLGDENNELFYYPKYQSFFNRTKSCRISDAENKIKLKIKTAKEYMINNEIEFVDFLKIDTEGFDLHVLKGFGEYLNKVKIIQFEYGGTALDNNIKLIEMIKYLENYGFINFSYLINHGTIPITNFSDHYNYCNIVCRNINFVN